MQFQLHYYLTMTITITTTITKIEFNGQKTGKKLKNLAQGLADRLLYLYTSLYSHYISLF
jgi:hypothetical protein